MSESRRALFLDRDGVIFEAPPRGEYLTRWAQCQLVTGIRDLVARAHAAGYTIIVVTNQSQVARGFMTEEDLQVLHEQMTVSLGGQVDAVYYCPHKDAHGCDCRKPKPGMLLRGAREWDLDLARSIMVGDSDRDVLAGAAAGCTTIFVRNPHNAAEQARCTPTHVVNQLSEIASLL